MNRWKIKNTSLDQNRLVEEIYRSRGFDNYIKLFNLDETSFNDPYLLKDMNKTVDRIMNAIKNKELILIYGDYDVDGITSTYILYQTIKNLGGSVSYDIPNRFIDGYGLSVSKAYDIINEGYNLVITVDNGIKSVNEAKILKDNNVELIITDHHEMENELPDAFSIIHTGLSDYPFKPLAGVGVAFKLIQALIGDDSMEYIDIVALGTVADMMPLIDENRAIVNLGLKKMANSDNLGFASLINFLNLERPSVADIQFKIAPRINACGRMKSAKLAVQLFESTEKSGALKYLSEIEENNNKRKKLTKILYEEALNLLEEDKPSIIIHSPKMHEGVIGIVASRLANEFSKVSVVLKEEEYTYKGSIRSYDGVDVIYILGEISDILIRHGGHRNAAGLEFKKEYLDEFKKRFNQLVPSAVRKDITEVEGAIDIYKLDIKQVMNLDRYDLKDCLFLFDDVKVKGKYLITGQHTKIIINSNCEAIFFNNKNMYTKITNRSNVALIGRLDINSFRGKSKIQILIEDYIVN
ncbi:MAG: Single-stranded-DNA-specific exonuclease RecJ [Candidatus Izimaplasma bacterium HR2]|nr:MAG: Single-stranded-DNA-specific exonuclease RecJ [Candidatus Izimaplasma bacterium HR2]